MYLIQDKPSTLTMMKGRSNKIPIEKRNELYIHPSPLGALAIMILISSIVTAFDVMSFVSDRGSDLCPFTNFCHTNASRKLGKNNEKIPCCLPCSCSQHCWRVGDCCPDRGWIDRQTAELSCKPTMVKGNEINLERNAYYEYTFGIQRYRIHDRCFFPENNNTLLNLCEGTNKTMIEQYQWVSDMAGRIFENRFCAACNHVTQYVTWGIQASCKSVLSTNVSYFDRLLLSRECDLDLRPPESARMTSRKYKCYRPHVSQCNNNGEWRHFNASLGVACETYDSPVIVEDISKPSANSFKVYKNIYCLVCNLDESYKTPRALCMNIFNGGGEREGILRRGFFALLDYEGLNTLHRTDTSQTCHADEVYESLQVSIPFLTPFTQLLQTRVCFTNAGINNNKICGWKKM